MKRGLDKKRLETTDSDEEVLNRDHPQRKRAAAKGKAKLRKAA